MKRIIFILGIFFILSLRVNATSWGRMERTCPICNHKQTYYIVISWGTYVYYWESKYQYVYWPLTESRSIYSCQECHFSSYMWDFDSIPDNKIIPLKQYLATVKLEKEQEGYIYIPTTTRLEIAENVYKILERNENFWCRFYRVMGYHYDEEKNAIQAKASRVKALNIAKDMLSDSLYAEQKKESFFIIAAMYNFIGNKDSALIYLDSASLVTYDLSTYKKNKRKKIKTNGADEYLTDLITQYKEFIKKENEVIINEE